MIKNSNKYFNILKYLFSRMNAVLIERKEQKLTTDASNKSIKMVDTHQCSEIH